MLTTNVYQLQDHGYEATDNGFQFRLYPMLWGKWKIEPTAKMKDMNEGTIDTKEPVLVSFVFSTRDALRSRWKPQCMLWGSGWELSKSVHLTPLALGHRATSTLYSSDGLRVQSGEGSRA